MGKSTRTKICGAVLTLAASAFGVDRLGVGPAGDESAATAPAAVVAVAASARPATPAADAPRAVDARPSGGGSVARRLQAVAAAEGLDRGGAGDAFKPSKLWAPPPPPAPPAPPPVAPKVDPAAAFRSRHRLTAVMQSARGGGGGSVMIDNKFVPPGGAVDGFVLAEVRPRGAVLRAGDVRVELALEEPKAVGSRQ